MKKVLVTGGLGFVGSNLVDKLVNQGNDVTVIDNMTSSWTPVMSKVALAVFAQS